MTTQPILIGVLALQGDFALHRRALERAGAEVREVRTPADLAGLDGLVLPGGESTTMLKLLEGTELEPALRRYAEGGGAVFGTCAGLILMAGRVRGPEQRSLNLLDATVERNAYGRQIDSFETDLPWSVDAGGVRGVFIRAPRIRDLGPGVEVLARRDGEPVLVRAGHLLAATFHPELTEDLRIHRYFLEEVVGARNGGPGPKGGRAPDPAAVSAPAEASGERP